MKFAPAFCLVLCGLAAQNVDASIVVTANNTQAILSLGGGGSSSSTFNGTTVPSTTILNEEGIGPFSGLYSRNTIRFTDNSIKFDTRHDRGTAGGNMAETNVDVIDFSLDSTKEYSISGFYNATNAVESETGRVFFEVELVEVFDDLSEDTIFWNYQESFETTNESFFVGGLGGDFDNGIDGFEDGTLAAGNYRLYYRSFLHAVIYTFDDDSGTEQLVDTSDGGATARGQLELSFGSAEIPEPATIVMWLMAIPLGLIGYLRHRSTTNHKSFASQAI